MDQNAKPGAESLACAAAEIQAPSLGVFCEEGEWHMQNSNDMM